MAISAMLHVFIAVVLALIIIRSNLGEGFNPFGGTTVVWKSDAEMLKGDFSKRQVVVIDSIRQPTPKPKAETSETATQTVKADPAESYVAGGGPKVLGKSLEGRDFEHRDKLLSLFGGTKKTEGAVASGLQWLAKIQKSDGRWELHQGYDDAGLSTLRTDTGATALALLCYLGAGHTHQKAGLHKDRVAKGLTWLKRIQKPDGNLHDFEELGRTTAFYAHAQGTIVLCEALALTGDDSLREPAAKAIAFIVESQNEDGGWKYQPRAEKGDLSVTGWQIMALQSARMAGLDVPEDTLRRAYLFLDLVGVKDGAQYKYEPTDPDNRARPSMTAEGLLCRQYLGWPKDHPALQAGVAYLTQDENLPRWQNGRRNVYYWYYATQVLHHIEGPAWEKWNKQVRDEIANNQVRGGQLSGSWHPNRPEGDPSEEGSRGGRLYVTCMCLLTLEVYYRHLPLYREGFPEEAAVEGAGE